MPSTGHATERPASCAVRHPHRVRYSVDPAAVSALARAWDGTSDALVQARGRVPEPAATGAGPELTAALAGFLEDLRDCLTRAATAATATADGLDAAAGAYAAVDAPIQR